MLQYLHINDFYFIDFLFYESLYMLRIIIFLIKTTKLCVDVTIIRIYSNWLKVLGLVTAYNVKSYVGTNIVFH